MRITAGWVLKFFAGVLLLLAAIAALGTIAWNIPFLVLLAGALFVFGLLVP